MPIYLKIRLLLNKLMAKIFNNNVEIYRTALETDLRIEREWRANLQKNLEQEKLRINELQNDLQQLRQVKSEHEALQLQYRELRTTCEEQEKTLAELGSHLSV